MDTMTRIEPTTVEPWVKLATGAELVAWGRDEEIAYNQSSRQTEKALFYRRAFDFLTDNRVRGDYHEYGCHRCRTFRMALTEARRHNVADMKFYAFDSFEGLPDPVTDTSVEIWRRGALTTSEEEFQRLVREHGIYVERVHTVKGFYGDSLTRALRGRLLEHENKIALVTIDFRTSGNGPLEAIGRGIMTVIGPVQQAVTRTLRPVGNFLAGFTQVPSLKAEIAPS